MTLRFALILLLITPSTAAIADNEGTSNVSPFATVSPAQGAAAEVDTRNTPERVLTRSVIHGDRTALRLVRHADLQQFLSTVETKRQEWNAENPDNQVNVFDDLLLGRNAVLAFAGGLHNNDDRVRVLSAEMIRQYLREVDTPANDALTYLVAQANEAQNLETVEEAESALSELRNRLAREEFEVRLASRNAGDLLKDMTAEQFTNVMIAEFQDESTLLESMDARYTAALIGGMENPSLTVRLSCAEALRRIYNDPETAEDQRTRIAQVFEAQLEEANRVDLQRGGDYVVALSSLTENPTPVITETP